METANKSYFHRGGDEPLTGLTIPEYFSSVVGHYSGHEAVVSIPQKRRLSYQQLNIEIDRLACGLLGSGFRKGDRIGVWSTNNIEWILIQMATARIGAILVNINPAYRTHEVEYALRKSEVQGLFTIPRFRNSNYIAILVELIPELASSTNHTLHSKKFPRLRNIVVYDPGKPNKTRRPYPGFTIWSDVMVASQKFRMEKLDEITKSLDIDDPINIQYTSGTTGFPKAVVLTHHNILNNALFSAMSMHFTERDRLCIPVPFYHCFGMVLANLLCFSVGACAVIPCEHFDAKAVLSAIDSESCTAVHGVPTMFIAELELPNFKQYDLHSLRTGIMAGAPCPSSLMKRVIEKMHCYEILIGYGETEASPLTHLTNSDDNMKRRVETVGRNLPHQEVKIIDLENGQTVPLNQNGEICFRGYHVMKGYYGDEDATTAAIDKQGWLHSGDIGQMDLDGYVKITGRLKEMIIRGGENIYPREIEDYLFSHPKISEVAVFGVPDEYYGEEIMAWIKLHRGETMTEQEVRDFCKNQIAFFKIPKYIEFVDKLPMTVTGKLQKFRMRELAVEKLSNALPV